MEQKNNETKKGIGSRKLCPSSCSFVIFLSVLTSPLRSLRVRASMGEDMDIIGASNDPSGAEDDWSSLLILRFHA